MIAFAACSKKSRVVERVEDIDYGFESLSAKDQQRIRKAIANRPSDKSVVPRKPSSKPRKCHKAVPIVHAVDTDTSCASSPPGYTDSLLRPQLGDTTVDWPHVPLDQLVDVAITGPLALVACDDDVETVSGDVDVDFADP